MDRRFSNQSIAQLDRRIEVPEIDKEELRAGLITTVSVDETASNPVTETVRFTFSTLSQDEMSQVPYCTQGDSLVFGVR